MLRDNWSLNPIISQFAIQNLDSFVCEIYCSGCAFHCKDCHNPELQNESYFSLVTPEQLLDSVLNKANSFIKELHVLGGEPLYNLHRIKFLSQFLKQIKEKTNLFVILFTGRTLKELQYSKNLLDYYILPYIDLIKSGRYIYNLPEKKVNPIFSLASNNQIILDRNLKIKY